MGLVPVALVGLFVALGDPAPEQADAQDSRTWFRDAKLGVFFHIGLHAVDGAPRNSAAELDSIARRFSLSGFKAKDWVALAKAAGAQYVVIPAKLRDGFSLFASGATEFSAANTPYGRDLVEELLAECRQNELRVGLYFHVGETWANELEVRSTRGNGGAEVPYRVYLEHQVRELVTRYGKIDALWLDAGDRPAGDPLLQSLHRLARELQPAILLNDGQDASSRFTGAAGTAVKHGPEPAQLPAWQQVEPVLTAKNAVTATACTRSPAGLIRTLVDVASRGGNLLLEIEPSSEGAVPAETADRLAVLGKWMFQNKSALIGAEPSPFERLPFFGRCTAGPDRIYAILFQWPGDGTIRLPGLTTLATSARLLAGGANLSVRNSGRDVLIDGLPPSAPDDKATVIVLDLAGKPVVDLHPLKPDAHGALELPVLSGRIEGCDAISLDFAHQQGKVHLAEWAIARQSIVWSFEINDPGTYAVSLEYAAPSEVAGSAVRVRLGDKVMRTALDGGSGAEFSERLVAKFDLPAGSHKLVLETLSPSSSEQSAKLRGARLVREPAVSSRVAAAEPAPTQ